MYNIELAPPLCTFITHEMNNTTVQKYLIKWFPKLRQNQLQVAAECAANRNMFHQA